MIDRVLRGPEGPWKWYVHWRKHCPISQSSQSTAIHSDFIFFENISTCLSTHLDREPLAIDAVLRACWSVALTPVELHLLCLESARQPSTTDKIIVLQQDSNCTHRTRRKMFLAQFFEAFTIFIRYTTIFLLMQIKSEVIIFLFTGIWFKKKKGSK